MKTSESNPITHNHKETNNKSIYVMSKGITRRLLEKYKPRKSHFSIDNMRERTAKKRSA